MRLTNRYNQAIYWLWSPFYDTLWTSVFRKGRQRALTVANLQPAERVLLVGIGTGVDLPLLPKGVDAVGIDISEAMLSRARTRIPTTGCNISLQLGDAQAIPMDEGTFDVVLMNLILSVVPDPQQCLSEALRVLRPRGRIVIFDKFLPDGARPTFRRRLANCFSTLLGTDLNRRIGDIVNEQPCAVVQNEPSILGGMYRIVTLLKK